MAFRASHGLLAAGLLLIASPSSAQEGMLFKNLMEGVVGGNRNNDIEYRQRPPLVVPPASTLPRPQDAASTRNAAWPNDPDVARRRAEDLNARVPNIDNEKFRDNPLLSQEELRRGRTTRDAGRPEITEDKGAYNNQIAPIIVGRELAAQRRPDSDTLVYGEEPPRRLLSEPPVGYRRPAATAAVGPGAGGPREDRQSTGQREFLAGKIPVQ